MCTFYGGSGDDAYVVASEIKVIGGEAVACCDNTTVSPVGFLYVPSLVTSRMRMVAGYPLGVV